MAEILPITLTLNQRAVGSSPTAPTNNINRLRGVCGFDVELCPLSRQRSTAGNDCGVRPRLQLNLTAPFHVFLQYKALSDRRRDDAIPEPLGQLSQRPPAGAVRRGDQLEVEGL